MGKKDPSARARANRRGGKHPIYIGVRKRKWGMWVSETREPMKQKSIWLGSIPTPEMAARAHDTAALALRGKCANFNFPESIHFLPHPTSSSTTNIQAATVQATYSSTQQHKEELDLLLHKACEEGECIVSAGSDNKSEVVESWLDWPSLLMNTADGMAIGSSLLCHSQFIEEEEQDHQYISRSTSFELIRNGLLFTTTTHER